MSLVILHPGIENRVTAEIRAAARDSVDGLRIGLLVNGKANAQEILDGIREALLGETGTEWSVFSKSAPTTAIAPDLLARVRERCNAVVAAVGD